MKARSSLRPRLETLEDRWCPALSINFDGSNLNITGFAAAATNTLNLTQNAADVTVADGATVLGTYAVTGNITVNLDNTTQDVVLAMGANSTAGSVSITLGSGGDDVSITGTGTISGNLNVQTGSGSDTFTTTAPVAGSATINLGGGSDVASSFAATADVGGNLQLTNVNTITLDGDVGGLFSYSANEAFANTVTQNAASTFSGLAVFTGGSLGDTYTLSGDTLGNVTASMGAGTNSFTLTAATGEIRGNLTVIGGVGGDTVSLGATSLVRGNVSLNLGNGTNSATLSGAISGSQITYNGGSGGDTLTYAATAPGARLQAFLGDGVDTFNLNSNSLLSGYIDFGNGADVFTSTVTINFPLTLRNL